MGRAPAQEWMRTGSASVAVAHLPHFSLRDGLPGSHGLVKMGEPYCWVHHSWEQARLGACYRGEHQVSRVNPSLGVRTWVFTLHADINFTKFPFSRRVK